MQRTEKKLFQLIQEWKCVCNREQRGEEVMLTAAVVELVPKLIQANERKIAKAGGASAWDALSAKEKAALNALTHCDLCIQLGEEAFAGLSQAEQCEVDFLVWAGCCMHKEMNLLKGGNAALVAWWVEVGLQGLIKLMNKDNAATAAAGPSQACDRVEDVSQAGGVKLASLAGAIFCHKDNKKGQQDTL